MTTPDIFDIMVIDINKQTLCKTITQQVGGKTIHHPNVMASQLFPTSDKTNAGISRGKTLREKYNQEVIEQKKKRKDNTII